jgi:hypothetical protein
MATPKTQKVKITKAVIVDGKHAAVGDVHEVSTASAQELIGAGTAEEHVPEGSEREAGPTTVRFAGSDSGTQHRDPTMAEHGDPATNKRDPKSHKEK